MTCKPNCAPGGTLSKTRLASCSGGTLAGSTGECRRAAPARYWPDTRQDPPARDTQQDTWRDTLGYSAGYLAIHCKLLWHSADPLASRGILGGTHWRAALVGYSAGSTGEPLWRDTRDTRRNALASSSGGRLGGIHWRAALAGCLADPLASCSGGILGGIHWRAALAGCWVGGWCRGSQTRIPT